ncbi:MAG: hypothetical protein K9L17_08400 [Clostridiales bacterium]|nr:hypothetical protein [Clostridiales bacterium]MCF8022696.1 hypothetical protein [Clostridiales bacterium]
MYGEMHPLSQRSPSGKIIAGLTLPQVVVMLLGAKLSYNLSQMIPALPFDNFIFSHVHHMVPLFMAAFFLVARHSKTGLPLVVYFFYKILFKMRNKKFVWGRK